MCIFNSWIVFHSHLLQYNLLFICLCPDVMMIHHSIVDLKIQLLHLHHFQLMIVDESPRKDGSRRKCWIVERSSICCEVGTSGVVSSGFPKARPSDLCICVGGKSIFGVWQGEGGGKMRRGWALLQNVIGARFTSTARCVAKPRANCPSVCLRQFCLLERHSSLSFNG